MASDEQVRAFLRKYCLIVHTDVGGEASVTGEIVSCDGTSVLIRNRYGKTTLVSLDKIIKIKELQQNNSGGGTYG